MATKIIMRDWHTAICKVAIVSDEAISILWEINFITHNGTDVAWYEEHLYERLSLFDIEYTNEYHRDLDISANMYDGYFFF